MRKFICLLILSASSLYCCDDEISVDFSRYYQKIRLTDTQVVINNGMIFVMLPNSDGPIPVEAIMRDSEGIYFLSPRKLNEQQLMEKSASDRHCTVCGKKVKGSYDDYVSHVRNCNDSPERYQFNPNILWPESR